jgi:RNA polymerase sigma-70 factor (ECF subfamily)
MSPQPLELLLEQLARGDVAAAEEVFVTYEAFLRQLVRRQLPARLRRKFDSADVVQSVWVHLLRDLQESGRRFDSPDHLRAFLVLVTRHRLYDRFRRYRAARQLEKPLTVHDDDAPPSPTPRPSEVAQAEDLWARMLALCPPEHRPVLHLRRQGLRLSEIAESTGLHEGSVRRILRRLARQVAFTAPSLGAGTQ